MKFRKVGNTGVNISTLSLGTWSLGGETKGKTSYGKISKNKSLNIISRANDLGVNFYDTSPTYGFSQKLLGKYFKKKRDKVIFCSKVGLNSYSKKKNFSKKFITKQLKDILSDLNTDYIDFIKLYCPDPKDKNLQEGYETLMKLKKEGLIRHIGVSLNSPTDLLKFNKNFKFDVVQCNLNLLDLRIFDEKLLNHIKKEKIGIIARTIHCFGVFTEEFLKKKTFFGINSKIQGNDHRSRWGEEQLNSWLEGAKIIQKKLGNNLKIEDIALRFSNSFDFISSSLIGVQSLDQLNHNLKNNNLSMLNKKNIRDIIKINKREFFINNKAPKRTI